VGWLEEQCKQVSMQDWVYADMPLAQLPTKIALSTESLHHTTHISSKHMKYPWPVEACPYWLICIWLTLQHVGRTTYATQSSCMTPFVCVQHLIQTFICLLVRLTLIWVALHLLPSLPFECHQVEQCHIIPGPFYMVWVTLVITFHIFISPDSITFRFRSSSLYGHLALWPLFHSHCLSCLSTSKSSYLLMPLPLSMKALYLVRTKHRTVFPHSELRAQVPCALCLCCSSQHSCHHSRTLVQA